MVDAAVEQRIAHAERALHLDHPSDLGPCGPDQIAPGFRGYARPLIAERSIPIAQAGKERLDRHQIDPAIVGEERRAKSAAEVVVY